MQQEVGGPGAGLVASRFFVDFDWFKRQVEKLAPNVKKILLKVGFYLDLFFLFTPLFVDFSPYGWYHINIWKISNNSG